MLVSGYTEMKPFLPAIEMKGAPTVFDEALSLAQENLVENIIGEDLEALLEQRSASDARLLKLCQRIISVEAFLKSVPEMDLVLTDAGFGVVSSQDIAPASKERVQKLMDSLSDRLDESRDRLVTYLMRSDSYSDWRGTEQFDRLSDGLILTFSEFRDIAVYNPVTAPAYPGTWDEFMRLNPAMNVALTSDVASYISREYALEILERIKDNEPFLPAERTVLRMVKTAVAAFAMGDSDMGLSQSVKAANFMKANIDDFPTYAASDAAASLTLEHADTPIFSMF